MSNSLKKVAIPLLVLLSFVGVLMTVSAPSHAETVSQEVPLKVEPQTKDLKFQNKNSSFFDFRLGNNDQLNQDLVIKVTNPSTDQDVRFTTSVNQATTSKAAKMIYDGNGKLVKNLFDFKQIVTPTDTSEHDVTLKPGESRDLHFHVQTPDNPVFQKFNGTILGGVYILEHPTKQHAKKVAYPVAIMINKGTSSPNLSMKKVKPDTWKNHNTVDAMIINNHPDILGQMDYKASVVKKGTNDVVAQRTLKNGQIGPNNQFKFEIPWLTPRITPGAYTMKVKISSSDPQLGSKGGTWFLEKDFTVSVWDAIRLNAKITHSIPWGFVFCVIVFFGLIAGLIYWLLKIRNQREGLDK
ncbi:WxL protein host-binding domain-containing protein [Fructilactobacillus frigidiflavus]|uniref:WxL protein host-binding domain-containing protein n=1 Tax=Fructilactobacillus frigidiflavus TaxID=3242688 RepID=UPI0037573526